MDPLRLATASTSVPETLPADLLAPPAWDREALAELLGRLDAYREGMLSLERQVLGRHPDLRPAYRASARNLAHYLALRREDLRGTQARLRRLGLSSLGRSEGQVLANLDAVRRVLHAMLGRPWSEPDPHEHPVAMEAGSALLGARAQALFGPRPAGRRVHVMVTLPSEAASAPALLQSLVEAGMDVARVNCAHDDETTWLRMVEGTRAAARAAGRDVRVLMDLGGPKLRTGALEPGPSVARWTPPRDVRGRLVRPARVLLSHRGPAEAPATPCDVVVRTDRAWVLARRAGDEVRLVDLRGRDRTLRVVATTPDGALCEATLAGLVEPGTRLWAHRAGAGGAGDEAVVGWLPPTEAPLLLQPGDRLVLTRDPTPGRPAPRDAAGRATGPATIPCTLPEVFAHVRPGQSVWLDDGRIGGRVREVSDDRILVEVDRAKPEGSRLGADKGINLPETRLGLPGLTPGDREDLAFVARHADLVGLSFVNDPQDVRDLWAALREATDRPPAVLVKVETRGGFERLPEILLAAMEGHAAGVMIARGDLAVECGFERLAEVQEEILWLCEAAHLPTVWATQVLETLAKKGRPTRAEITDAAMSERAECVMLNKGPHVVEALRALDDILCRMEAHQTKKHTLLRRLRVTGTGAL